MSKWLIGACAFMALGAFGCAPPPKVVTAITSGRDQIKFLVVQGRAQQVVKCTVAPADGALSNCKTMAIVLQDEE